MEKILLVIEKSQNELYGRVQYDNNLIVDSARSARGLENKFRKLLHEFHALDIKDIEFEHAYDITALFDKFKYLNITSIAAKAKINPSLLRQYASGVKYPSPKQAKKLEDTIQAIGRELSGVVVFAE